MLARESVTNACGPTGADLQQYLPIVHQIVNRFIRRLPPNVLRDDLLAAGTYGLVDAFRKNGDARGPAFEWYARMRIRGAILDELRTQDWLSRRERGRATKAKQESPATSSGATVIGFDDLSETARDAFSDEAALSPFDQLAEGRKNASLSSAVALLPERERMIVSLYYFQGAPFKAIAAQLGVSEPRISQLHARAMGQLRGILGAESADLAA
jgi:RNA polymerase sigma factor for flagellar operon FliA